MMMEMVFLIPSLSDLSVLSKKKKTNQEGRPLPVLLFH